MSILTKKLLSIFPILCIPLISSAQCMEWHRSVIREITIDKPTDIRMKTADSSLIDMLYYSIKSGNTAAYSPIDNSLTSQLKPVDIDVIIGSGTDTVDIEDPVTGNTTTKIIKHDSGIHTVHKYRILEEWAFDRASGITHIRIVAIAPLLNVYREEIKSTRVLFWCKYTDVAHIISRHKRSDKHRSFIQTLKAEYLNCEPTSTPLPTSNKWISQNERVMDIDPADTLPHQIRNAEPDSSFSDIISARIDKGAITIYDSVGNVMQRSSLYRTPDTIEITDPVTGYKVYKLLKHSLLFYGHDPRYKLIENWTFDFSQGIIESKITYVVPFGKNQNDYDGKYPESSYWLKFEDISPLLLQYEHGHYSNSIAHFLWNDYFLRK